MFGFANDVKELVLARHEQAASEKLARLAVEAAQLGSFEEYLVSGPMFWDERCRELFDIAHEKWGYL